MDNERDYSDDEPIQGSDYMLEDWQLEEMQKCSEDFLYFAETYVKITHPKRGLIPFKLFDYQKRMVGDYTKSRFNILSKFRQCGATTTTVLYSLWLCIFRPDQRIMIVSIGDREAIEAGRYVKIAIEELPTWMRPEMGKNNDHEKEFVETNSVIWFLSPKAARSKSLSLLIIDEAAFIAKMDDLWKAMMPTLSTGGSCIVISTVNGLGNWYEETFHRAKEGKSQFNIIEIDYWEHPEYSNPDWIRTMKAQMKAKDWQQEFERSFLGSGDTYISADILVSLDIETRNNQPLRKLFPEWDSTKETFKPEDMPNEEYVGGALWVWKEPEIGREYAMTVDCAEGVGEGGDNSAFHVIDTTTNEQVAEFYSDNVPTHTFSQIVSQIGTYYNSALVIVENMGPGLSVISRLQHNLYYDNLYFDKDEKPGIKVGPQNRPLILEALKYATSSKTVKINSRRLVRELKTFNFNKSKKRPEAQKGLHDDLIIALALGLFVRDEQVRKTPIGAEAAHTKLDDKFEADLCEQIRRAILDDAPEYYLDEMDKQPVEMNMAPIINRPKRPMDALLKEFGW